MTTTRLTTCNNAIEANLLKGMLENNGIPCFLANENFSHLMPHYNGMMGAGVQVIIDEADLVQAKALLLAQSEAVNELVCPNCDSVNVGYGLGTNKIKKFFTILLSLAVGMPFGNLKNTYYCHDCKTEFTK